MNSRLAFSQLEKEKEKKKKNLQKHSQLKSSSFPTFDYR